MIYIEFDNVDHLSGRINANVFAVPSQTELILYGGRTGVMTTFDLREYDRGDSFIFAYEPNGLLFGS